MKPLSLEQARNMCSEAEVLLQQAQAAHSDPHLVAQALELYHTVLEAELPLADPLIGLAYLVFSAQRTDDAFALLELAMQIEPSNLKTVRLKSRLKAAQSKRESGLSVKTTIAPILRFSEQIKAQEKQRPFKLVDFPDLSASESGK